MPGAVLDNRTASPLNGARPGPARPPPRRPPAARRSATQGAVGLRLLSGLVLLGLWQGGALLAASPVLPSPVVVAQALYQHCVAGDLPYHLSITLCRVAVSFVLAMVLGTAIGLAMGLYRRTDRLLDLWLVLGLNLPALVIMILCYVWLGLTETAAILAVVINKVPIVAVGIREGARAIDPDLTQVAAVLRLGRGRRLRQVYLPQLYPYLLAATRSGLALIWKIVLVVELIGRSSGVGFQLGVYFQFFDIASVLAYTVAFIIVVLVVEAALVRPLERRLTRWRP